MDQRIRTLGQEVAQGDLSALKSLLYFAVDHIDFGASDAKKVLLTTLLYSAIIENNENDFQMVTPKSFYNSVSTTTRKGIQRLATEAEVTGKTGEGLLNSPHQTLMLAQWKKDLFVTNDSTPSTWCMDSNTIASSKSLAWSLTMQKTVGGQYNINPGDISGAAYIQTVYCVISIVTNLGMYGGSFHMIKHSVNQINVTLGTTGVTLVLNPDGTLFFSSIAGNITIFNVSASFNATKI